MKAYHNSREMKFRTPFGAVKAGTELVLTIDIWDGTPSEVTLRVWAEGIGEQRVSMEIRQRDGGFTAVCTFKPEETGLCWYRFELRDTDGSLTYYGAQEGRQGGIGQLYAGGKDCPSYQISVYKDYKLPAWYRNAIVYQIFPDRFARTVLSDKEETGKTLTSSLTGHANGPKRHIVPWDKPVSYERNQDKSIAAWDFYGGSLRGIIQKLEFLRDFGITAVYLNPIFEAASNHRYDTGDYMKIDPLLGTEDDFRELCDEADKLGISVILDGVFNHTGCDSIYFNKYGNYDSTGAYQSEASPYRSWYSFNNDTKDGYDSWWGVSDLPSLRESEQGLRAFIYGNTGVVRKWLQAGAKGWRLDVADELPDDYIEGIRKAVKEELGEDGLLIGEVWEDASNKISYGARRRYLQGDELDSVMNYPFCDGTVDFLTGRVNAAELAESMYTLMENYPREAFYGSLNLLGSHDRKRILTVLGDAPKEERLNEEERAAYRLSDSARGKAKARLWLGVLMQMTMPGVPCIYYGDEAGLEGYDDPYNRAPYPWGDADADCMSIYRNAIGIRHSHRIFTDGDFEPFAWDEEVYGFTRRLGNEAVTVLINRSQSSEKDVVIPCLGAYASDIISGKLYSNSEDDSEELSSDNSGKEASRELMVRLNLLGSAKEALRELTVHLNPLGSAVIYFATAKRLGKQLAAGTGVLCHITSLPRLEDNYGVIGKACFKFIDYLKARGDKYWQILPLNPVDHEGSPYAGSSAFAGNARLLPYTEKELHELYDKFNAEQDERIENDASKFGKAGIIEDDSDKNTKGKAACDAEALANIGMTRDIKREYEKFIYENAKWLDSYAMYQAIRKRMQGKPCREWEEQYRTYKASLWNDEGLKAEAEYYRFEQYIFETEWLKVRTYAREQGISIIGDMPIYVSEESADVWEHPEFFNTDEEAGVPPDYFSEEGQSWGNPLYRWDILKKDGFGWWMRRFKRAFKLYDAVRLDHFRGFEAYWAIPRGEKAVRGHWMPGPGAELFEAAYRQFGALPIIAEDLGFLTPGVRMLMANAGFPGMDVMQFSDIDPLDYYSPDCDRVSYTGTHDNETLLGWCKSHYKEKIDKILRQKNIVPENINYEASANLKYAASENEDCMTAEDKKYAAAYDTEARVLADRLLSRFYDTDAFIKIVPLQDILGLDNAARMNTPGTLGINWRWQAKEEDLYDADTI